MIVFLPKLLMSNAVTHIETEKQLGNFHKLACLLPTMLENWIGYLRYLENFGHVV
jgi:hypothetical protein